ncbi:MAG: DsbA family protein [Oceanicaulis sp.]
MFRAIAAVFFAATLAACSGGDDASAQAEPRDREAIEEIVRAYILENPEIIEEALIELQRRAREREQRATLDAVAANAAALEGDSGTPVAGASDPVVTIVEFFDYRCSFCALTNDWVQQTLASHGDQVRFVFKEWPVRGEQSLEAARASLAVWQIAPDAYLEFHNALMTANGPLPSARIDELAEQSGVNVADMRAAMDSDAVREELAEVDDLARQIGVRGTPFFVVGDAVIPGADLDALQEALDRQLES